MAVTPWRARAQCRRAKEERKKGSTIYKAVFLTPNDRNKFPNSPKSIEIPPVAIRSKACMEKVLFRRQAGDLDSTNMIREIKIIKDSDGIDEQADIMELFSSILPKVEAFNSRHFAAVASLEQPELDAPSETPGGIKRIAPFAKTNAVEIVAGKNVHWDQVVMDHTRMLEMHAF